MDLTLTRAQAREFDRLALAEFGLPGLVLMENAGRGAADLLLSLNPAAEPVLVLCGRGNNGGDGFVLARHLDARGLPVRVAVVGDAPFAADAAVNVVAVERAGLTADVTPAEVAAASGWVVDALFGTGLTRGLAGPYDRYVAAANAAPARVLALDLPSGLDGDTGEPLGPAVEADVTATFVAPKRGFANPASRRYTGDVRVVGIGTPRRLLERFR